MNAMKDLLSSLKAYQSDETACVHTGSDIEDCIQELAFLTSQYRFSEREFQAAGVNVETLQKWITGLALLTEE